MEIKTLKAKEKEHLTQVLVMTAWDLSKAARLLQIPLSELRKKMKSHFIEPPAGIDYKTDK
jgi:DNA-binding NtrC family response regulator